MVEGNKYKIAIIGTGMIGSSLAALFTGNGYQTKVYARSEGSKLKVLQAYKSIFDEIESRKLIEEEQRRRCEENLRVVQSYEEIADAEIIFEAVPEIIDAKQEVYQKIEHYCESCRAIISTSSAKDPDFLAELLSKHKDKFLVAHPFNPPHLVPFFEMVLGSNTDQDVAKQVYDLLEYTGRKVCLMKKSAPGFIANRLQHALLREAFYMVEQGMCSPRDIDKALMYSFMPRYTSVGLFEHQDAAGLDLVNEVESYLFPYLCDQHEVSGVVRKEIKNGNLGQKSGHGIYEWDEERISNFRVRTAEPYWKYFNWKIPSNQ